MTIMSSVSTDAVRSNEALIPCALVHVNGKGTLVGSGILPPLLCCVLWPQPWAASVPEAPVMLPVGVDFSTVSGILETLSGAIQGLLSSELHHSKALGV